MANKTIAVLAMLSATMACKAAAADNAVKQQTATAADSMSYAAGVAATEGLQAYLKSQFGVDSTNMEQFVAGFEEVLENASDPALKARWAGIQIAQMAQDRILPQMKGGTVGTPYEIKDTLFYKAFAQAVAGKGQMGLEEAKAYYKDAMEKAEADKHKEYKAENEAWLAANKKKSGVKTTKTGLQYKILEKGSGAIPKATDKATVKYEGKMIDGTVFDSSYQRDPQTSTFRCDQVIAGWTEALTMMPVGSKWELYIPQELAYGSREAGKIKPYSTLVFTVELVSVEAAESK